MVPSRIVSGGQTGADRAALDVAVDLGLACGGRVPRGRLAEDGRIPDQYPGLVETESPDPAQRTEQNVLDADATLILSHGRLRGGSRLTRDLAATHRKPCLHLDLDAAPFEALVASARDWLNTTAPDTLNVAGPRASQDPRIYPETTTLLRRILRQ